MRATLAITLITTFAGCGWLGVQETLVLDTPLETTDCGPASHVERVGNLSFHGWVKAREGGLGGLEASSYKNEVRRACEDGEISTEELAKIEGKAAAFLPEESPVVDEAQLRMEYGRALAGRGVARAREAARAEAGEPDGALIRAEWTVHEGTVASWSPAELEARATALQADVYTAAKTYEQSIGDSTMQETRASAHMQDVYSAVIRLERWKDLPPGADMEPIRSPGVAAVVDGSVRLVVEAHDHVEARRYLDRWVDDGIATDPDWLRGLEPIHGWTRCMEFDSSEREDAGWTVTCLMAPAHCGTLDDCPALLELTHRYRAGESGVPRNGSSFCPVDGKAGVSLEVDLYSREKADELVEALLGSG